jgi:outer membrane protein assembly factor BamB
LSNCSTITIDREKHTKERGWNGGNAVTPERWESDLKALDPLTGEIRKSVHLSYPNFSGTLSTGGGLVFLALLDGTVAAFDDTTLDQLWKINVGSGFSAPPITFEVNWQAIYRDRLGTEPRSQNEACQYAGTPRAAQCRRAVCVRVVSEPNVIANGAIGD